MKNDALRYWLMKSEPDVFSIDDLQKQRTTSWSGVRNYQARNFMRDDMKIGDLILYYHSSTDPAGVVGVARVCRAAHPDLTAQDPDSPYFDPGASAENPKWVNVDVMFVAKFKRTVTLERLKSEPALKDMMVTRRGMRLSIQPVEPRHFKLVENMGNK